MSDCFATIRSMLERTSDRPSKEDVVGIYDAFVEAYQRLMRVRQVAPTVDYSDKMWSMMGMVGLKRSLPAGRPGKGSRP